MPTLKEIAGWSGKGEMMTSFGHRKSLALFKKPFRKLFTLSDVSIIPGHLRQLWRDVILKGEISHFRASVKCRD